MLERITLPILNSILHCTLEDDVYLDEKSFALLLEIQKTLSVFEPIDDDEARKIWLEIPRGAAAEWKAFDDTQSWYDCSDEDNLAEYQEALDSEFPYEKEWFFLVTTTYREYTFLKISDRDHRYVILTNRTFHDNAKPTDMRWFLEPLLQLVKDRVSTIVKDVDAYNRYIEENLPYRQRSGLIKSKDLNRIIPQRKMKVKNRKYCIQVMKELIRRKQVYESVNEGSTADWETLGVPAPLETMSIRTFCKYYRIADIACWSKPGRKRAVSKQVDDIEFYRHSFHGPLDEYDLDSEKDYKAFAKDHYGELGLSRMNVGATQYYAGGKWLITFGISYSAHDKVGLKIALALYETGAPFIFYDAENLLHTLEETGTVRISPFTFHDYLKGGDDEGIIDLPHVEDCDKEGELTRAQYDEIVQLAQWEPDIPIKLDSTIPLDDPVYDLIREEVDAPMTLSEIRHRIEKKYDTYLSVFEEDRDSGYYYIPPERKGRRSAYKSKDYYHSFNEAMKALILEMRGFKMKKKTNRKTKL